MACNNVNCTVFKGMAELAEICYEMIGLKSERLGTFSSHCPGKCGSRETIGSTRTSSNWASFWSRVGLTLRDELVLL